MEETKLTGHLPTMNIEVTHRAARDGSAEIMTIQLSATPDFRTALPLLENMAQFPLMMANPLALWTQAANAWLAPWMALAQSSVFFPRSGADRT